VVIFIIISTAITYTVFSMEQITQATETVEIKQTSDFQKTTEEFEVLKIEKVNEQFNMTVTNNGDIPVHLTRLWVENTTDSTWPISKYDLDVVIPSGYSATNIGQNIGLTSLDTQSYLMKLVSERGNTEKMFLNSVNNDSIYLNLRATPVYVATGFSTTLVLEVINTGSNKLLNLQAEIDSVIESCTVSCFGTYVSGPTPTSFASLNPGDIATFEWVYTLDGETTGDNVTFTASLVNGVDTDTAVVSIQPVEVAENAEVSLESLGITTEASIDKSILLFHQEQDDVPNGGYQLMSVDSDGGVDGTRLPPGAGGTITHGTFTFDADNDSDETAWTWTSSGGSDGLLAAATGRSWSHETDGTGSGGVGPCGGQGGGGQCESPSPTDGHVYTEASTPTAAGDTFDMEFNTNLDASTHSWEITFYHNQRGANHDATVQVQINENLGGWTNVGSQFGGSGDPAKVTTSGDDVWTLRTVDLSNSGANIDANTDVRILIDGIGATQPWHNDAGIDTVTITGTAATTQEILPPVSFMTNNGTGVTIPAGIWNASLWIDSAVNPLTAVSGPAPDIKYHMEDGDGVNPDNSVTSSTGSNLQECGGAGWCSLGSTICDNNWDNRFEIVIDETKVIGSGSHTNFPVLVSITGADFTNNLDDADDSINDIRFLDDAGALLDYEIEKYDKTTNELIAWVQIASLPTGTDHTFYMYFDNAQTSGYGDEQDAAGTWNTNYKMVQHMNEDPSVTAPQMIDSTSNNNDATSSGSMTSGDVEAGQVGDSIDFDGSNDFIYRDMTTIPASYTIELWMYATSAGTAVAEQGQQTPSTGWHAVLMSFTGTNTINVGQYDGAHRTLSLGATYSLNTWYHVALTFDNSDNTLRGYVDGVEQNSMTSDKSWPSDWWLAIGANAASGPGYWTGNLDEVFVSDDVRSAGWITTTYNNQNSPSTFYSLTTESTGGGNPPDWQEGQGPHGSGAYYYDGVAECHRTAQDVSSVNTNDVGGNDAATSLWFKTDGAVPVSTEQMLVFSEGLGSYPSSSYYKISLVEQGKVLYEFDANSGSATTTCKSTLSTYDDGSWYNAIGVRDESDNSCDLYIYDVTGTITESVITGTQSGTGETITHDSGDKMYVGSEGASDWFKGWIDDVFHWNTVELTSTEVEALARVDHGTDAHKFDVSIDIHDGDGVFLRNEYSLTDEVLPYHDPKHYDQVTNDLALGNYNITMSSVPEIILTTAERLNFTMAFQESSGTWQDMRLGL
jgi:hypothetical protein